MKGKFRLLFLITSISVTLGIVSCDEWIEYSPYENIVDNAYKNQNIKNYNRIIEGVDQPFKPFKIGLIADTHTYYDEFEKQVAHINTLDDLDFIIHMGDITLSANSREFKWYSDIMNKIKFPVITLIGNHDCLGNGYDIYKEMFGDSNFSFVYKGVKFVMFDDVIWEKNIEDPDFVWFNNALENTEDAKYVLPFAHIYPWDSQFSIGNEYLYNEMMKHHKVPLSVHGHGHSYQYSNYFGDEVNYLLVPSCIRNEMVILDFQQDTIIVNKYNY
nr:metallophosphoesterase [uncultured Carboxylicivirga sp.]